MFSVCLDIPPIVPSFVPNAEGSYDRKEMDFALRKLLVRWERKYPNRNFSWKVLTALTQV